MKRILGAAAALLVLWTGGANAAPRVTIADGALSGSSEDGVASYKNIPFAAPPVGALRWRAPAPPKPWSGVRDATAYGPACPQPMRGEGVGAGTATTQSEDCLQLNVWAPEGAKDAPVMVWIHGGAHRIGSGTFPTYDGTAFAKSGIVLVTVNYRLGLLGYFAHPALTAEAKANEPLGNYGFLDQLAALKWVKANIAAFGGDPDNVTAFGESAGGASLIYLLASPQAKGLFQKAIVESGGGLQRAQSLAATEQAGVASAARIGLSNASAGDLRAQSAEKWVEAQGPLAGGLGFGPFVDGRTITEPPWKAFRDQRANDVPLIIGANSNEASVFGTLGIGPNAVTLFAGGKLSEMKMAYGVPPLSEGEFARQAMGDATFVGPARWIAREAASGASAYLYHFSYVAAARRANAPGANHGSEIPYVFQTWDKLGPLAGRFVSPQDKTYSAMMHACWVAFAKTGKPACAGAPAWPAYTTEQDALMEFAPKPRVVSGFRRAQLDFVTERSLMQAR